MTSTVPVAPFHTELSFPHFWDDISGVAASAAPSLKLIQFGQALTNIDKNSSDYFTLKAGNPLVSSGSRK